MATHSSTLAWKIPWTGEPCRLQSMGSLRDRHDWATSLSLFPFLHWRRKWQRTPVFLPGESQGWGSLVGYRLWGRTRVGNDWNDLAAVAASILWKGTLEECKCSILNPVCTSCLFVSSWRLHSSDSSNVSQMIVQKEIRQGREKAKILSLNRDGLALC